MKKKEQIIDLEINYAVCVEMIVNSLKKMAHLGLANVKVRCEGVIFPVSDYFEFMKNEKGIQRVYQTNLDWEMLEDVFLKLTKNNVGEYKLKVYEDLVTTNKSLKVLEANAMEIKKKEWLERGKKNLYPQMHSSWEWLVSKAVEEAYADVENGAAIEMEKMLDLMEALDDSKDLDFEDTVLLFFAQDSSTNLERSICARLLEYHKKGPDFLEYEILKMDVFEKASSPELGIELLVKNTRNRNTQFELEAIEERGHVKIKK